MKGVLSVRCAFAIDVNGGVDERQQKEPKCVETNKSNYEEVIKKQVC
ncbi:hypothetical protein Hanom_Chr07g00660461 [Helianthus anomalus]